jgi:hypothetical protein
MTLGELQHAVNLLVERGTDINTPIRITTADPCIGGRTSVGMKYIYHGMDWEKGEIRVEPDEKVVRKR